MVSINATFTPLALMSLLFQPSLQQSQPRSLHLALDLSLAANWSWSTVVMGSTNTHLIAADPKHSHKRYWPHTFNLHSSASRNSRITGATVGSAVIVLILITVSFLYGCVKPWRPLVHAYLRLKRLRRRRSRPKRYDSTYLQKEGKPTADKADVTAVNNLFSPYNKLDKAAFRSRLAGLSGFEASTWSRFLFLYGKQGIALRDLAVLSTALYSPLTDLYRYSHWTSDGDRGLSTPPATGQPFFLVLKEALDAQDIEALESKLISLGGIQVKTMDLLPKHPGGSHRPFFVQTWIAGPAGSDKHFDNIRFSRDLLDTYACMPDRDVHLDAERQREIIQYHARIALQYILRSFPNEQSFPYDINTLFVDVSLRVLSYRCQRGDENLRHFVQETWSTASKLRRISRQAYTMDQCLGYCRRLTIDTINLKAATLRYSFTEGGYNQAYLRGEVHRLRQYIERTMEISTIDRKTWGMVGYALVELMGAAETLHERNLIEGVVQMLKFWCQKARESRSAIELAALCSVLVKIRAFDKLDEMPEEYYLSCGFYLSRAGFLPLAARFLLAGIQHYQGVMPAASIWRYYAELWTVNMRQGHWEEVEQALSNTDILRSEKSSSSGYSLFNRSGELRNLRLTVASLRADCYTARGNLGRAKASLLSALGYLQHSGIESSETTEMALEARLLNLYVEIRALNEATATATQLCRKIRGADIIALSLQTLLWTVQEIQACADVLIQEERHVQARRVLGELKEIALPGVIQKLWLNDLSTYLDQRQDELVPFFHSAMSSDSIDIPTDEISCIGPIASNEASATSSIPDPSLPPVSTSPTTPEQANAASLPTKPDTTPVNSSVEDTRKRNNSRMQRLLRITRRRKYLAMLENLEKPPQFDPLPTNNREPLNVPALEIMT
ncbi:MAG: hypothetical protein Q9225_007084 [Loekoesia sp. 1 TL-2023]